MKKKIYTIPQVEVYAMEMQKTLAASQFQTTVNGPTDEVDAEDALSREFSW
jgi:hypothetical protein